MGGSRNQKNVQLCKRLFPCFTGKLNPLRWFVKSKLSIKCCRPIATASQAGALHPPDDPVCRTAYD